MAILLKRAYVAPTRDDGERILVERLWPRGLSKERAHIDFWLKDVAPSAELRRWYNHDVDKWPEFEKRYRAELRKNDEAVQALRDECGKGTVTFVYAAKDEEHNSAVVLKDVLEHDAH